MSTNFEVFTFVPIIYNVLNLQFLVKFLLEFFDFLFKDLTTALTECLTVKKIAKSLRYPRAIQEKHNFGKLRLSLRS